MTTDDIIEIAAREVEQAIVQTAAEDGIDLDATDLDIFPEQRAVYKRQMAAVLAVVEPIIRKAEREACAKVADDVAKVMRLAATAPSCPDHLKYVEMIAVEIAQRIREGGDK